MYQSYKADFTTRFLNFNRIWSHQQVLAAVNCVQLQISSTLFPLQFFTQSAKVAGTAFAISHSRQLLWRAAKLPHGSYRELDWSSLLWPYSLYVHYTRHSGLYTHTTAWWKYRQAGYSRSRIQSSVYSGSRNTEHRHYSHIARPVSSPNTHGHAVTHTKGKL